MNILHSSRQDDWMTPPEIIGLVERVLGTIDLDPASSHKANQTVGALMYHAEPDDGLTATWGTRGGHIPLSIYLNPPGGKIGNRSKTHLFWERLMHERAAGRVEHAIFMFFSVEGLAVSQGRETPAATDFPTCIPAKRIRFVNPWDASKSSPSHSNAIVYVPGTVDRTEDFATTFSQLGAVMVPYRRAA